MIASLTVDEHLGFWPSSGTNNFLYVHFSLFTFTVYVPADVWLEHMVEYGLLAAKTTSGQSDGQAQSAEETSQMVDATPPT